MRLLPEPSVNYYVTHRSNVLKTIVRPRLGRVFVVTGDYTPTRKELILGRSWRKSK